MHWLYLAIAIVFETTVGIAAGKAEGFRKYSVGRHNAH